MESAKKSYLVAAVLVAVLIAVIGYSRNQRNNPEDMQPSASVSPSGSPAGSTTKSASQSPKTYTDYVKAYVDRRIQFDINCQAVPSSLTFKNGTMVMFDNRSGDARKIKVGDTIYQFPGYGYRIITLTSTSLPKNLLLSCGSAVNVGQILLQK